MANVDHAPKTELNVSAELLKELHQLRAKSAADDALIAQLQDELGQAKIASGKAPCDPKIADVLALTEELFSGRARIEILYDLEASDEPLVVVTVRTASDASKFVEKRLEWYQRLCDLTPGNSGIIALSIVPV